MLFVCSPIQEIEMETRIVFDLLYSFPVIYSPIVIPYERLATLLQLSILGQVICMEGRTQCFAVTRNPKGAGHGPGFKFLPLSGQELPS